MDELNIRADCQAFFFDFDGVLVDSVEVKTQAFGDLFAKYGPEIQAKVIEYHRRNGGMTRKKKFRHYYTEFLHKPYDEEEIQRLSDEFSTLVVDKIVAAPEILGAQDFLRKWHQQIPCFVLSAVPDVELQEIADRRGLMPFFQEVLGAGRSKEEHLASLLETYGFAAANTLFFGDAVTDYRAARSCAVPFLGILPGPDAPLLNKEPDIRWVRNFTELG